ncbi:MAG: hypothetical protein ACI4HI_16640 [Lachnospiraceae bacterium]
MLLEKRVFIYSSVAVLLAGCSQPAAATSSVVEETQLSSQRTGKGSLHGI